MFSIDLYLDEDSKNKSGGVILQADGTTPDGIKKAFLKTLPHRKNTRQEA